MKKYIVPVFILSTLLVFSCENSLTDSDVPESEEVDEAIEFLRGTDNFDVQYVDISEVGGSFDDIIASLGTVEDSGLSNGEEKVVSFFTSSYYKQRSSTGSITSISDVEQYAQLPDNYVAIGVGGRCTSSDFTVAWLKGASISSTGIDFGATSIANSRHPNVYALEAYAEAPTGRVVIGVGLWVGRSDVRALSIYTAPYNATTKEVMLVPEDVDLINESYVNVTIIKDGPAAGNATVGTEEVRFRTFDHLTTLNDAKKAVITSFGAGVHKDNANRIGLEFSILPN